MQTVTTCDRFKESEKFVAGRKSEKFVALLTGHRHPHQPPLPGMSSPTLSRKFWLCVVLALLLGCLRSSGQFRFKSVNFGPSDWASATEVERAALAREARAIFDRKMELREQELRARLSFVDVPDPKSLKAELAAMLEWGESLTWAGVFISFLIPSLI